MIDYTGINPLYIPQPIPGYVWYSNHGGFDGIGPQSPDECYTAVMKAFPHIPREAVLVVDATVPHTRWSSFVAQEFEPDVARNLAKLRAMQQQLKMYVRLFDDGDI